MRIYVFLCIVVTTLGLGGAMYVSHISKSRAVSSLPKTIPPQAILDNSTSSPSIAAVSASEVPAPDTAQESSAANSPAPTPTTPAGLTVNIASDGKGLLKGKVVNTTAEKIVYQYPAGTLFSNGKGEVVLLHDTFLNVAPKETARFSLPVAQTSSAIGILSGEFTPHGEADGLLRQLVHRISIKNSIAPAVAQTAVLILLDDAPLDTIASFPRLRPRALANSGPKPFCASPEDLIAARALIRNAGIDPNTVALMSEPQLKVMTMLNSDSHEAAMALFGITQETEWTYWQTELLQGDPALRHYALYGIARYFPEVALEMLPRWVRTKTLARSYRIAAAWALALIDDPRANEQIQTLRHEYLGDPGLRQALDGALRHREDESGKAARIDSEAKLNL